MDNVGDAPAAISQTPRPMSSLGQKADIEAPSLDVRFIPESGHSLLFDHLVGNGEQA
jgi:hypothetical protein